MRFTQNSPSRGQRRRKVTGGFAVLALMWSAWATSASAAPPKGDGAPAGGGPAKEAGPVAPASRNVAAALSAARLATHHYKAGRFKKAARLYHEAYAIAPKAAFLFNAGRAEMRGFAYADAKRDLNAYLKSPQATEKGSQRARMHLAEISAYETKIAAEKRDAEARAKAAAAKASADASRPIGALTAGLWVTTGVLLVSSGALYGVATMQRLATNKLLVTSQDDKTRHDREVKNQDNLRNISVLVLLGAAGTGVWAILRTRATRRSAAGLLHMRDRAGRLHVDVSPWSNGKGLSLVGRF